MKLGQGWSEDFGKAVVSLQLSNVEKIRISSSQGFGSALEIDSETKYECV